MTDDRPDLSDPEYARFAWRRYRKLMAWMALAAIIAIGAALAYLRLSYGPLSIHMIIATVLGVGLSVLLGTALMGLVFLSSGTGHDEKIQDFSKDENE
ncbi:hypothetical protein [Sphingomonas cavernae]|uniref:Uncharacterized protein n=1 Tax=Sphingomonas cavernae TaxID=2320861 RepID=A0A418WSB5_9SPHN|nr:hypothetical protein [Sphingomonas cavernae]RJF94134.1 hypothetical protein D3876_07720 [Sphingomonas cavernae]